jgi:hypothetical protein
MWQNQPSEQHTPLPHYPLLQQLDYALKNQPLSQLDKPLHIAKGVV